jgi:hypothetical protein
MDTLEGFCYTLVSQLQREHSFEQQQYQQTSTLAALAEVAAAAVVAQVCKQQQLL